MTPYYSDACRSSIRLHLTFIDTADGEQERAALLDNRRTRAASAPAPERRSVGDEVFKEDRAYVAALDDKMRPVWGFAGELPPGGGAELHLRRNTTVQWPGEGPPPEKKAAPGRASSGASAGAASTAAEGPPSSPALWESCAPSLGGLGHPELCAPPCVFLATRGCNLGSDCRHCHMAHARRPAQLDKRRRQMLRDMSGAELKAVVLLFVKEKVNDFAPPEQTTHAFDRLLAACGLDGSALADLAVLRKKPGGRPLVQGLRGKNIHALLVLLQNAALQHEPDGLREADAFLQHLREVGRASSLPATAAASECLG